jgi:hypothetical protein
VRKSGGSPSISCFPRTQAAGRYDPLPRRPYVSLVDTRCGFIRTRSYRAEEAHSSLELLMHVRSFDVDLVPLGAIGCQRQRGKRLTVAWSIDTATRFKAVRDSFCYLFIVLVADPLFFHYY